MARTKKQGLEYFRHYSKIQGKTMDTLQADFGNDGYAFWFKLLEILAQQDELFYDCSTAANWRYLASNARISTEKAEAILNLLCDFEAIDSHLWREKRIIWVQKLVNNAADVYEKRKTQIPQKPNFCDGNASTEGISVTEMQADETFDGISVAESTQSKVKESKVKESKVKKNKKKKMEGGVCDGSKNNFHSLICEYTSESKLQENLLAFIEMRKAIKKPMTYHALQMLLNRLDLLSQDTNTKNAILEQSIFNSWQSVYEYRPNGYKQRECAEKNTTKETLGGKYANLE